MMTTISDLPGDLVREIFSRVPLTSLKSLRSTCKTWNALSRNLVLGQKAARKNQFLEFMVKDSSVCSLRFDLQGVRNGKDDDDLIDQSVKQISIPKNQDVEIEEVHHCDGLLLCVTRWIRREKDCYSQSLLVWNPYLGQTRWIRRNTTQGGIYAMGYGYDINNNRDHKIFSLFYDYDNKKDGTEVYDFSSDSWRVIDANPESDELFQLDVNSSVSIKGNAYFLDFKYTPTETEATYKEDYLVCFDFTRERFGPRLPLPFKPYEHWFESENLFWVRDEKLAVLHYLYVLDTMSEDYYNEPPSEMIEIWISTKIEPNAISWSIFLRVDMNVLDFHFTGFFIEEDKKVVVFLGLDGSEIADHTKICQMASIVEEDGYFISFNIGAVSYHCYSHVGKVLVCSSYAPSLVQLQINQPEETEERNHQPHETKEQTNQPDERNETNQPMERKEQVNQPDETKEKINQPYATKEQTNQPDETKEQINQQDESKQKINQPDESKEKINQRGKRKKRNQRGKRKDKDVLQWSVPFSIIFLFLALFISSFVFFYFLFGASLNLFLLLSKN